jgi:hypothetical protein
VPIEFVLFGRISLGNGLNLVLIEIIIVTIEFWCRCGMTCELRLIRLLILIGLIKLGILLLANLIEMYLITVHMRHIEVTVFFCKRVVVLLT